MEDAAYFTQVMDAKDKIVNNDKLDILSKARALTVIDKAVEQRPPHEHQFGIMDLVHGAIGAGLGGAAGTVIGSMIGMPIPGGMIGMGLGAVGNMGLLKSGSEKDNNMTTIDQRNAFRVGFIKQALANGYFDKEAGLLPVPTLPLTPDTFLQPVRGLMNATTGAGRILGATTGYIDSLDETDEDMVKMQAEQRLLEKQEAQIAAERRNRLIKQVLAKRNNTTNKPA